MPIPPSYCSGGADNTRLIEADVSDGFYDLGGDQIDLGTVWWRWLRSSGFVAMPAESAIESVSIEACKIKVID